MLKEAVGVEIFWQEEKWECVEVSLLGGKKM